MQSKITAVDLRVVRPSDLRRGNIIKSNGKVCTVGCISKNTINSCRYQIFEPIELTPDILLKAGFEKHISDPDNINDGFYYTLELNNDKYCDLSFISGDKNGIFEICLFPYETLFRFRYVHQLQNLYYSLTHHDLTINF